MAAAERELGAAGEAGEQLAGDGESTRRVWEKRENAEVRVCAEYGECAPGSRIRRVCRIRRFPLDFVRMLVSTVLLCLVCDARLHRYFSLVSPLGVVFVSSPGELASVAVAVAAAAAVGGHQPP